MQLKPQDVLVLLSACIDPPGKLLEVGGRLGLSASEVLAALRRLTRAQLLTAHPKQNAKGSSFTPVRASVLEFLVHGVRFVFVPDRGGMTRGVPTAHAAPILAGHFAVDPMPPVWPWPTGKVRGEAFSPIYGSAPRAAASDPRLYDALALVDVLRGGRARERSLAAKLLAETLAP